jgi:hypothetical protein
LSYEGRMARVSGGSFVEHALMFRDSTPSICFDPVMEVVRRGVSRRASP